MVNTPRYPLYIPNNSSELRLKFSRKKRYGDKQPRKRPSSAAAITRTNNKDFTAINLNYGEPKPQNNIIEHQNNQIAYLKKRVAILATKLKNCESTVGNNFAQNEVSRLLNDLQLNPLQKSRSNKSQKSRSNKSQNSRSINVDEWADNINKKIQKNTSLRKRGGRGRRKTSKK